MTFSAPSRSSRRLSTIQAGTTVIALTGEVHTIGGQFVVKRYHGQYEPGDVLLVYTCLGEGFFKVWFRGKMYQEDLGFSDAIAAAMTAINLAPDGKGRLQMERRQIVEDVYEGRRPALRTPGGSLADDVFVEPQVGLVHQSYF